MRKKKYVPREERNEDLPVNKILVKLQTICFQIDSIDETKVDFQYISYLDEDFKIIFSSIKGPYSITMNADVILESSSEDISKIISTAKLVESKKDVVLDERKDQA